VDRDLEGAVTEFQKALRLDPGYAPAHRGLAETYVAMERGGDATLAFRDANRHALEAFRSSCQRTRAVYKGTANKREGTSDDVRASMEIRFVEGDKLAGEILMGVPLLGSGQFIVDRIDGKWVLLSNAASGEIRWSVSVQDDELSGDFEVLEGFQEGQLGEWHVKLEHGTPISELIKP
jgi:hypothetical protein